MGMRLRLLSLLLAGAAAIPAQAEWREASTDHFVIYSEQGEAALKEYATRLERYDSAMRVIRSLPDEEMGPANRVTVYVVRNVATVQKLFGAGARQGRSGIAGFYMPRANGSVAITPRSAGDGGKFDMNAEIVLLHEYAHDFMARNYPGAFPAWFIEGFAEFHSTARFEKDGGVGIGNPALHRAYGLLNGPRVSAETLMTLSAEVPKTELREALYGRGWLLTHYLTFEKSRQGQLQSFIRSMNEGKSALEAAKSAFGDLNLLDKELDRYMMRSRMSYWMLPAEKLKTGPIAIRTLSPAEDAVMDVKIRSRRGVDREQALKLLPEVRRAAAPFPNSAFAQATLGEAEFDAGYYKEAEAAADRAIAADPKYIDGFIYKARARMASVAAEKDAGAAKWKDVRRLIATANRLDPDDPEPLILFYSSFLAEGIEPTKNAVLGLTTALQLAPQDRGLRMMAAFQFLKDGRSDDARSALIPVAFDPHGGGMSKAAAGIIAKLDAGGAKEALKGWQAFQEQDETEEEPS